MLNFRRRKEIKIDTKIIYAIILLLVLGLYFISYFNKVFPVQGGWFALYDKMMLNGQKPYKDFYYYMSPFTLFTDHILLALSQYNFCVYYFLRILERLLTILVVYTTLVRYFKAEIACLACIIGGVLNAALVYDLFGDYSQTSQLCFAIICYFTCRFAEEIDEKAKNKFIALAGFFVGVLFTLKQSSFLGAIIFYPLGFIILAIVEKEKKYYFYIVRAIVGALVPVAICLTWIVANGSWKNFWNQVYFGEAKGDSRYILIESLVHLFRNNYLQLIIAVLIFVIYVSIQRQFNQEREINEVASYMLIVASVIVSFWEEHYFIATLVCTICLLLIYHFIVNTKWGMFESKIAFSLALIILSKKYWIAIIKSLLNAKLSIVFIAVSALIFWLLRNKSNRWLVTVFTIIVSAIIILMRKNIFDVSTNLYEEISGFERMQELIPNVFCFIGILLFVYLISKKNKDNRSIVVIMMLISIMAYEYSILISSTESIACSGCYMSVPVILAIFLCEAENTKRVRNVILVSLVFIILSYSQKISDTYSWWGWNDSSDVTERAFETNIPEFKGIKFSEEKKIYFEQIVKLIKDNTNDGDTVFEFPHMGIFNVLTDRNNIPWNVPIVFYDVCPDSYAKKVAKSLSKNPPNIVVWCDIPDCMETYENLYNNGEKLGQRDIQTWFSRVKDTNYTLIGQIENTFIYKLNDNSPINYTYITRKSRPNETAETDVNYSLIAEKLEGLGTRETPFLINDETDFGEFCELVNEGESFEDLYIKQTRDLDLSMLDQWRPAGIDDTDFAGTYDGDGHTIVNAYYLSEESEDISLFCNLNGLVINLAVKNAWFGGQNVALIAGSGRGSVINCYADGIIHSYQASGIADDISGGVSNCLAQINVEKAQYKYGIVRGYNVDVESSYSNISDNIDIGSGKIIDANTVSDLNKFVDDYNSKNKHKKLKHWVLDENGFNFVLE